MLWYLNIPVSKSLRKEIVTRKKWESDFLSAILIFFFHPLDCAAIFEHATYSATFFTFIFSYFLDFFSFLIAFLGTYVSCYRQIFLLKYLMCFILFCCVLLKLLCICKNFLFSFELLFRDSAQMKR